MKYQNHTAKYYASKAIKFAEDTVKYPNIPQSTYDKGFFAVEGALADWETAKYNAAFGWWVKELDRLEESGEVVAIKPSELQDIDLNCLADTLKRSGWGQQEVDVITRALAQIGLER